MEQEGRRGRAERLVCGGALGTTRPTSERRFAKHPARPGSVVGNFILGQVALQLAAELDRGDLGLDLAGEELEAAADVEGLEQFLLEGGVVAEAERGDVDEGFRIVDGLEELRQFVRAEAGEPALQGEQAGEFEAQALVFVRRRSGFAGQRANVDAAIGLVGDDVHDPHPREPLEQEIGGAVVVFLAGADDAHGGDAVRRFELSGHVCEAGIEAADGKQAVCRENVLQHVLVAGLKNVQRQE